MTPDARVHHVANSWYYRELLIALMVQEDVCVRELAARLGVPRRSLHRYLGMERIESGRSLSLLYPQQFLAELMLCPETRSRLAKCSPTVNWR